MKRSTEAFVAPDLFECGIGYLLVSRFKSNDRVELGLFLVDVYCLGVKDAFFELLDSTAEYEALCGEYFPNAAPTAITPETARKLVESAVAYAARLGFLPARDYKKACRVFGGIDAGRSAQSFSFGKDGKPFYVGGPYESVAQQERIVRQLEAKCGSGNYDFLIEAKQPPEEETVEYPSVLTEADRRRFLEDLNASTGQEFTLSQDGPKISERLMKIAEPFLDEAASSDQLAAMAIATVLAWNFSTPLPNSHTAKLKAIYAATPEEMQEVIEEMVARKKELYPEDNRFVVHADIVRSAAGDPVFIAAAVRPRDATV